MVGGRKRNAYAQQCLTCLSLSLLGVGLHMNCFSLNPCSHAHRALQWVPDLPNYMHTKVGCVLFSYLPPPTLICRPLANSVTHFSARTEELSLIKPANHRERMFGRVGGGKSSSLSAKWFLRQCLRYGNGISHFRDFSQGQCATVCMCQSGVYLGRVEKFIGVGVGGGWGWGTHTLGLLSKATALLYSVFGGKEGK